MDFQSAATLDRMKAADASQKAVYPLGDFIYVPSGWAGAGTLGSPRATQMSGLALLVEATQAPPLSFGVEDLSGGGFALHLTGSLSAEASAVNDAMRRSMPSQDNFEYLARHDAPRLLQWIGSGKLPDAALTFAAEEAGLIANSVAVAAVLIPLLLESQSPPVREGAVYGLQRHLAEPTVREALRRTADMDTSAGVREAAQEALEQLED